MRARNRSGFAVAALLAGSLSAQPSLRFERTRLTDAYLTEGAAIGDLDGDGIDDIAAGTRVWPGPDFTSSFDLAPTRRFRISTYTNRYFTWIVDVDEDGRKDVVTAGIPGAAGVWFRNPGPLASGEHWESFPVAPSVQTESPTITQLVAGGPPELVCAVGDRIGYLQPDAAKPEAPWVFHPISPQLSGLRFLHGLGVGDLNGDGRSDLLTKMGWFEQPAEITGDPVWTFRPFSFAGFGGAQMLCIDVDGDSDLDVVSSLHAHGYGLSWFENLGESDPPFREHRILPLAPGPAPQFSQLHALLRVDLDGDGLEDFVTGKTFFAHNGNDPGAFDPAVLVWFRLVRDARGARFEQIQLDDDSGIGRQLQAADLDGDGRPELITSNKKGVFRFRPKQLRVGPLSGRVAGAGALGLTLDAGRLAGSCAYAILVRVDRAESGIRLEPWRERLGSLVCASVGVLGEAGDARSWLALPVASHAVQGLDLLHVACVIRPTPGPGLLTNSVRVTQR